MALDVGYTNGVIATREKYLLKEKISRLCELSAEEAFRALLESGFGGGAETATDVYDYEKLVAAEEAKLDEFIREYAPSEIEKAYLLAPRDFHNAKALIKAAYLQTDATRMLSPAGLVLVETLSACVASGDFAPIKEQNAALGAACEEATEYLKENENGAKVGEIFEGALYKYLWTLSKKRKDLKKLLQAKADMTNILIAFRATSAEEAEEKYLPVGSVSKKSLALLFDENTEKAENAFAKTPYKAFVEKCYAAKEKGLPPTEAEKIRDGYETAFFAERKYELEKSEPFLYYVYRRRAESANVRIVFVCLLAGLSEHDVKNRLRAW
ncbi:MAG: V-type ATPase subunit [Clostridia bacterium]|nr:V-type ATPase subunit [Clostridia bacterium]